MTMMMGELGTLPWVSARVVLCGLVLWVGVSGCNVDDSATHDDDVIAAVCEKVECATWQTCCAGSSAASCVDVRTDPLNCGGCQLECGTDEVCSLGQCAATCDDGLTVCDRSCVDLMSSRVHCGGCGEQCAADAVCLGGRCEPCEPGGLLCDGLCLDPRTDRDHCGATSCSDASARCADDEVCDGEGQCSTSCAVGFERCGDGCHDLDSSGLHCGACETSCDITERCASGQCVCREGLESCGDECVALDSDARHCGACGQACAEGEACREGECTPCDVGQLECDDTCVDPLRDPAWCGATTCEPVACEAGNRCIAGVCRRGPGHALATGRDFACALTGDGDARDVVCWGANDLGQVTAVDPALAFVLPTARGAAGTQVALGADHGCVLDASIEGESSVLCWGRNHLHQAGAPGTVEVVETPTPIELAGAESVIQLVAARHYGCALTRDERVWCWGRSPDLGDVAGQHDEPYRLELTGIVELAAGADHLCALSARGRVWCWGSNQHGQLGADLPPQPSRVPVTALDGGAAALTSGVDHSCALMADGQVLCWGNDDAGQVGADAEAAGPCGQGGASSCVAVPAPVVGLEAPIVAIEAGDRVTCALDDAGQVWCWGSNADGRAGQSPAGERLDGPTRVATLTDIVSLATTGPSAVMCARDGDDRVWCWGDNTGGVLGVEPQELLSSGTPLEIDLSMPDARP